VDAATVVGALGAPSSDAVLLESHAAVAAARPAAVRGNATRAR
jgi:hypothetical protein